jgi:hypothetical protein
VLRTHRGAPVGEFSGECVRGHALRDRDRLQQLALPRRARKRIRRQGCGARHAREPALGHCACRRAFARELRQRGGDYFAGRVMVVLRGEVQQLEYACIDHRVLVEHFEDGLELVGRQFRTFGVRVDDADESLPSERHTHARAGPRSRPITARQVIEQAPQRGIERNAQNRRWRQERSLRVFHNVCG